jgi:uncharacterized protein (DUF58 family)
MSNEPQKYLDPKTLDKIKRLDLRARLVVEGFITGQHRSPYNGFAVEFASHREYTPGDDIRHIDWKVWSKTDRLYIKEYEEETNLKCTLIVDASKSMAYGQGWRKFDYAATAAASLAYLLHHQQDAVGLVTFDTKIGKVLPPSSHPSHMKLMLHELEQVQPDSQTDVHDVFPRLAQQIRARGLIAIFSDLFVPLDTLADALQQFRLRRHEVVVFHVLHEDELKFPFDENTLFRGMESEDQLYAEPRALRRSYLEAMNRFRDNVRSLCASSGIEYVPLATDVPLDAALSSYLSFRQKTRKQLTRKA